MSPFWQTAYEFDQAGTPFVVITLVSARGHVPQEPGAKAIVTAQGLQTGTVGGGKVEARAIEHALQLLSRGATEPEMMKWNLQRDIGMTCGGETTYLFEVHNRKNWNIVIFGAGHVSQALIRVLQGLDCQITCVDSRGDWLAKLPSSPKISIVESSEPAAEVANINPNSYFVVMTHGHATDLPILAEIVRAHPKAPYIGVMGSDVKAQKLRQEMRGLRLDSAQIEKLHSPIGLTLGENVPAEIAISIVAELLLERDQSRSLGRENLKGLAEGRDLGQALGHATDKSNL
jgi:xanthine dehydrogenase accessory factor